jgi:hypothetical protein
MVDRAELLLGPQRRLTIRGQGHHPWWGETAMSLPVIRHAVLAEGGQLWFR